MTEEISRRARFRSPHIVFRMEGRPLCNGGRSPFGGQRKDKLLNRKLDKKAYIKQNNTNQLNTKTQYGNIIKLLARSAMAEAGWEISDEPVYLVITYYVNYPRKKAKAEIDKCYDEDLIPERAPKLPAGLQNYSKWLQGVVYRRDLQIACSLLLKRYTRGNEHVDFLIGRPKNYEDLIYDIRNN